MRAKLFVNALTKFLAGLLLTGLLLFLPAGTLAYPGGWLFIGLLFIPCWFWAVSCCARPPTYSKSG